MTNIHLFFDLDRTLWDFETNSRNTLVELYEELNLNEHIANFKTFHYSYIHINNELWKQYGRQRLTKEELRIERFRKTLQKFKITSEDIILKISEEYVKRSPYKMALMDGAEDTLRRLFDLGYNMHILTNGFREVQTIKLNHPGLKPYFKEVICSEDAGRNKPHRSIFEYALKKANCSAEKSIMIGDDYEIDIVGALNANLNAILFDPENRKRKARDFRKITHLKELPEILPFAFHPGLSSF